MTRMVMDDQQRTALITNYSRMRAQFLRDNKVQMKLADLQAHCLETGEQAAELYLTLTAQLAQAAPEEFQARMEAMQQAKIQAHEMVLAELITVPLSTSRQTTAA